MFALYVFAINLALAPPGVSTFAYEHTFGTLQECNQFRVEKKEAINAESKHILDYLGIDFDQVKSLCKPLGEVVTSEDVANAD